MIDYAESKKLEFNQEEYEKAEEAITIRLKALIAQNIWGYSEFYEIFNELNPTYKKGISLLQNNDAYKNIGLPRKYNK